MKKRRAVVVGYEYHARLLSELMNAESREWRFTAFNNSRAGTLRAAMALRNADALISFGGPAPIDALAETAHRRNVPVFVIWSGLDVFKARQEPIDLEIAKHERFINLSDSPWLIDELRDLGVNAEYVPVTAAQSGAPIKPFPRDFQVLTYLPQASQEFYGASLLYRLARAMPETQFVVTGSTGDAAAPDNVRFLGLVIDMDQQIDDATVLLRMPQHDGKSQLVLEALARGRHVVWNYDFPAVVTARDFESALSALQGLRGRHESDSLELNHEGRAFVLAQFARDDIARRLAKRLDLGLREWEGSGQNKRYRVAISGLDVFCASVATFAKEYAPAWDARVLRMNSRLNVLTSLYSLATCDVWYLIGSPLNDRFAEILARLMRKPRVMHWVGSDILVLGERPSLARKLGGAGVMHLAEVDWTARQLRTAGLASRIVPLPPRHRCGEPIPMPARFTIMLYVPRTRGDFYGRREFERLMRRLHDEPVRYVIVGGGELEVPPGIDAQNYGWRDALTDIYHNASVLVRFTPRDGLSLMVLEALSFGRHVLWTQPFPYTTKIRTYDDMEREITALLNAHKRGELKPRLDAAEAISQKYSVERSMAAIESAWSDAIASPNVTQFAVETPWSNA